MPGLFLCGISGWGKSWYMQSWLEANTDAYDGTIILDWCDEFRGLVTHGPFRHWIAGAVERGLSAAEWSDRLFDREDRTVLARHPSMTAEEWRQVCARVIKAGRRSFDSVLFGIDEAHFVAPQATGIPDPIVRLATTGRGGGASAIWSTQRPSEIDKSIISQCQEWVLGGLNESIDRLREVISGYPPALHDPAAGGVDGVPPDLWPEDADPTGDCPPVRLFEEEDGSPVGSEWIRSNNAGELERLNTRHVDMEAPHVGQEGKDLSPP